MSTASVSRPAVGMLRATLRVDPARECPHRESLDIHRRTATSLRAGAHVRRRIASSSKDTGASRRARTSAQVRGPILAMRGGRRGVLTPWARLPFGRGVISLGLLSLRERGVLTPWPPLPSGEG